MAQLDIAERTSEAEERVYLAPQWLLMWWRFRRHRVAVFSAVVLAGFYLIAAGAEFMATSEPGLPAAKRSLLPPQRVHFFEGWKPTLPYVYPPFESKRDPVSFKMVHEVDESQKIPLRLFARGFEYKFLGLIRTDRHLIGVGGDRKAEDVISLLGADEQGRDLWSRLMIATRLSLSLGLVGVVLSMTIGIVLGGVSGYFGGIVDTAIQRLIEVLISIPGIPLWLTMAAALPQDWTVIKVYFAITIILSLISWTGMARVVRGRFLALRTEDFVTAARLSGAGQVRTMFRHMLPSFYSHIIASASLAVPGMILAETSLSFLGLGMRPPAISYGVMLQQAQKIQTVALAPWVLVPAIPVIIVVLAFNFMGDGIRDAADPYGQ